MIAEIKCYVCNELIGTIEKQEITAHDVLEYQKMTVCSLGHGMSSELVEEQIADDEWGSP